METVKLAKQMVLNKDDIEAFAKTNAQKEFWNVGNMKYLTK